MKFTNYALCAVVALSFASCSHKSSRSDKSSSSTSSSSNFKSRSTASYEEAQKRAFKLTEGWPQASKTAATEMIQKHGEPNATTSDRLVWRNVAPYEEIVVHREVYSSKFPILHQNALSHVVSYKVPVDKMEEVRRYNGDLNIDARRGEVTATSNREAMNILSLNLAHEVIEGRMSPEEARIKYGKEALNLMNGEKSAMTQVLRFGEQYQTTDQGESITQQIEWKDETKADEIQAEEAAPMKMEEKSNKKVDLPADPSEEPMKEEVQREESVDPSFDLEE